MLLHGWPEFWYTWRKNIPVLAGEFDVVVPDLRGFGDTHKPGLPDPPKKLLDDFVEDLRALAESLGFERFGVVSHNVGAYVAQGFARKYPERLSGLFFFNCPPELPKIGTPTRVRWGDSVLKVEWADRLGDYFADLDFSPMREAGHFAHYERPDLANREISDFFGSLV